MSGTKVEFGNRKQFFYVTAPGTTAVFAKVNFGVGGAVSSYSARGIDGVTQLNAAAKTGVYRIEFTNRYLDIVGFNGTTTASENGDGYDVVLIKDQDFLGGSSEVGAADAYQDGYLQIQFFQGGTQKLPINQTAYLQFFLKTSEQG